MILTVSCCFFAISGVLSQNENYVSTLKPDKSTRFLKWENVDNLGYTVRVFRKELNGSYTEVHATNITKNFIQLNKEYLTKNHYYRVEGRSTGTLTVVGDGDVQPVAPLGPGSEFSEEICVSTCHGPNYAWSLHANENFVISSMDNDNDGYYDVVQLGTGYLTLSGASGYYEDGNFIPFYMIMDNIDLNNYRDAYYYATGSLLIQKCLQGNCATDFDYFWVDNLPVNHGYRDKNGNIYPHQSGWLVKKSMFEFDWMSGNRTTNLNIQNIQNLCTTGNSQLWTNSFNSTADDYELNADFENQNPTYANATLFCQSTPYPGQGNGSAGCDGYWDDENPNLSDCYEGGPSDWAEEIYDNYLNCISDWLGELDPENGFETDCIGMTTGGNNGVGGIDNVKYKPVKIIFTKLDGEINSEEIVWSPRKEAEFYMPNNIKLEDGLYLAQFILRGRVIPYYFENIKGNNIVYKIKDFVSANLLPNPIQGNSINLDLISAKKIKYTLKAFNLNGENIHQEQGVLNEGLTKNLSFKINKKTNPYNQVRIVVEFEDGSTIEKTALFI